MADVETGIQLRSFFLELLADTNLIDYYENRDFYIDRRVLDSDDLSQPFTSQQGPVDNPYLDTDAQALLRSDSLREIEESIRLVTGSGKAVPIWVVSPPMSDTS